MEYQKKFEQPKDNSDVSLDAKPDEALTVEVAESLNTQWKQFKTQG
jgi:hypothetical protein